MIRFFFFFWFCGFAFAFAFVSLAFSLGFGLRSRFWVFMKPPDDFHACLFRFFSCVQEPAQCRTYDYMGEAACDARTQTFLNCIDAVRDQTKGGFAAVKLSALGDPLLLSQLTTCVHVRACSCWFFGLAK